MILVSRPSTLLWSLMSCAYYFRLFFLSYSIQYLNVVIFTPTFGVKDNMIAKIENSFRVKKTFTKKGDKI